MNQVELTISSDCYQWARVTDHASLPADAADGVYYGRAQKLLCGTTRVHKGREIWNVYAAIRWPCLAKGLEVIVAAGVGDRLFCGSNAPQFWQGQIVSCPLGAIWCIR